jgi:anti-anti-sigma factor
MIRLVVPRSLRYRDVALRTVAGACRIVRPRRATDPRPADLEFDDQVVTSVGEAFTNLVQHGDPRTAAEDQVEIEIETQADRLTVRLLDHGTPFDPTTITPPDLTRLPESGMGVHIMRSWMDDVSYRSGTPGAPGAAGTNVLSLTKRLGEFSRSDQGDRTTLSIAGVLDATTAPNIRRTMEAIVAERRPSVVLELSRLNHVDSSGVGVIVSLYKRCNAYGGTVRVEGLKDQPLAIFKLLRLDRVFGLS